MTNYLAVALIILGVLLIIGCAGPQRYLDDDRNIATMPFDKLIVELAK